MSALTGCSVRQADDEELDSDNDVNRAGGTLEEEEEQEYVTQERITMDLEIPRQPIPEPSDGEVYFSSSKSLHMSH